MAYGDNFKEQWNKVDEHCPYCNNVTKRVRGLTKQNVKNLFFSKPKLEDMIILAILILTILGAIAYNHDTKTCRETLNNIDNICMQYNTKPVIPNNTFQQINITALTLNNNEGT